jgi:hypothetical protein
VRRFVTFFIICLAALTSASLAARSVVERLSLSDLVERADVAVRAEVLSAHARRNEFGWIVTDYELRVSETLWGEARELRRVTLPGGVLPDGVGTIIPGMPTIEVGERALLFLSPMGSRKFCVPLGLSQGKFRERTAADGQLHYERSHAKLQHIDPATGLLAELDARERFDGQVLLSELRRLATERRARRQQSEEAGR